MSLTETANTEPRTIINTRSAFTILLAGAAATLAFDVFGQYVSPALKGTVGPYLGAKLAPVPLANQSLGVITGLGSKFIAQNGIGELMHYLTGLIIYPAAYLLVARPVSRIVPVVPWWAVGLVYGAVLFVFALYVMAHLVSGLKARLS